MVPLQAILAMLFRSMGKILNTAFGWATVLLFGKVPERKQFCISIIAFSSVIWFFVALSIAFPRLGTFLLAFVPVPPWVDATWIRLAMLAATLFLPLGVGALALYMVDARARPQGTGPKIKALLKGYPYTIGLVLTLLMMLVFAPVMKIIDLVRRWTSSHLPMVVEARDYLGVVKDIEHAFRRGGIAVRRTQASWMIRVPTKVFTVFAGGAFENLVADELTSLKADNLEVLLHPSDLVIRGKERQVMRAHALITEHLTFTKAYQTWSKEANQIEDRLTALWQRAKNRTTHTGQDDALDQLQAIEKDMGKINVSYDEWDVLFREKLIVERALLRARANITEKPEEFPDSAEEAKKHATERRTALQPVLASLAARIVTLFSVMRHRKSQN